MMSCIPQIRNLKPTGDTAEIKTKSNRIYTGELLTVTEDSVLAFIKSGQKDISGVVYNFPKDNIQYIKIEDYINYKWQGAILGFEVVPILLLFVAATAAEVDSPGGLAILFVPVLLNYIGFAASTPDPPGVVDPFQSEQLVALRKYSRFPQGLNDRQLKSILSTINQAKIPLAD
jgi:hypothetical protein